MRLVVDANILFAALIKKGTTAEILISDKLHLFAPEFLFKEYKKYEKLILKKTKRSKEEFNEFFSILKDQITIIPKNNIKPFMNKANELSPDPKDTVYLALALLLNASFWSNDKKIKQEQQEIKVYSTTDLINRLKIL
jgi:predicted nucleic acid-binding protein